MFAAAAVVATALLLFRPDADVAAVPIQDYGELVALDDTLRDAMPLIDLETLDILLQMPLDPET